MVLFNAPNVKRAARSLSSVKLASRSARATL